MTRKNKSDLKIVGIISAVILLLLAAKFMSGTFSVLSAQGIGSDYKYVYAPFNEDYVLFNQSFTTNESMTEATWLFRHDTDKAYPQNISAYQAGTGGLWIDTINNQTYYDIQREPRPFYTYGTCTVDGNIQATEIREAAVGGFRGMKCLFPTLAAGTHTYKIDLLIEFKPRCAVDTFQPSTCNKAWYMVPFIQGKHIQGKDYNNCATHRCEDDVQWLNIVVVMLAIAAAIILVKRRMMVKK